MTYRIIELAPDNEAAIRQVAQILYDGFAENWPDAWPNLELALQEVHASFEEGRISRVAVSNDGTIVGWIGAISAYGGKAWELHPLVVRMDRQRQGIGRRLVRDLEECVRERGAVTLWLGTDDESDQTSLANTNLYTNIWNKIANIKNLRHHPFEFYQKLGFAIVGVLPDANGIGKPDILMAKRVHGG